MTNEKTILITGATGKQGGAAIRHLAGAKGLRLRAMTRKPDGEAARALAKQGVEIVAGDLDDAGSLRRALEGAWGVFAVQNTWEAGVEREEEQGKRLATLAREAKVQHFVQSSVGSAHLRTGIPHFDNKARIEAKVKELGFPSHAILRPVFFMENLTSPWFLHGDSIVSAMDPKTVLQMIAVEDVGRWAAKMLAEPERFRGVELDVAGDAVTMPRAAEILSSALGRAIAYARIPIEEVRKNSADFAIMLEWFDRVGYSADVAGLERTYGIRGTTLADWARSSAR